MKGASQDTTTIDMNHNNSTVVEEATAATGGRNMRSSRSSRSRSNLPVVDATNSDDGDVETGRRENYAGGSGMESSLLGPAAARGDVGRGNLSGMEIHDDEIFGNLDSSFASTTTADRDCTLAATSRSGTRSADTSAAFNVSVFRRQPLAVSSTTTTTTTGRRRRRSSSIVGKDDAPIRPSSRGPTTPGLSSTFSLGNFRRRRRQPSILLSSAQKAGLGLGPASRGGPGAEERAAASGEDDGNENAVESEPEEEEESFLPEAEGTPVRMSKARKSATSEVVEPGSEAEAQAEPARETRSRKRKSDQGHDGGEAAKRQAAEAAEEDTIHPSVEMASSPPSFAARRRITPELDEAILAPPVSDDSSSEGSPAAWPALKNLGKRQQHHPHRVPSRAHRAVTPALDDDMSDISEPPSLTHSPNFGGAAGLDEKSKNNSSSRRRQASSPKLSTADLEALLPRRRRKVRRDDYDLDSGDSASETGDKAAVRASRAAKKKKKTQPATKPPLKGSLSKSNQTKPASAAVASAPAKSAAAMRRRTYGSRSFNKENTAEGDSIEVGGDDDDDRAAGTPLEDTAFDPDGDGKGTSTPDLPEELRAASRKFREVDRWELDFEEVVEPSSDLPEGR